MNYNYENCQFPNKSHNTTRFIIRILSKKNIKHRRKNKGLNTSEQLNVEIAFVEWVEKLYFTNLYISLMSVVCSGIHDSDKDKVTFKLNH